MAINYKNFIVIPSSYFLNVTQKWYSKVRLLEFRKSDFVESPLIWNKEFNSKADADIYAIRQVKLFIRKEF